MEIRSSRVTEVAVLAVVLALAAGCGGRHAEPAPAQTSAPSLASRSVASSVARVKRGFASVGLPLTSGGVTVIPSRERWPVLLRPATVAPTFTVTVYAPAEANRPRVIVVAGSDEEINEGNVYVEYSPTAPTVAARVTAAVARLRRSTFR
jgi:hypothetical protein